MIKVKRFLDEIDCCDEARKYAILSIVWDFFNDKTIIDRHEDSVMYDSLFESKRIASIFAKLNLKNWKIYAKLADAVITYTKCIDELRAMPSLTFFVVETGFEAPSIQQMALDILYYSHGTEYTYEDLINCVVTKDYLIENF